MIWNLVTEPDAVLRVNSWSEASENFDFLLQEQAPTLFADGDTVPGHWSPAQ